MAIKPIPTRYKGYRFRSRLEARWAVFFDACGYQWEYEPEGFVLPCGTHYLPDFKIFGHDTNGDYNVFWIEVKPTERQMFLDKKIPIFARFINNLRKSNDPDVYNAVTQGYGDFIILDGPPAEKLYWGTFTRGRQWLMEPLYRGRPSFHQMGYEQAIKDHGGITYSAALRHPQSAANHPISKALGARFEHGESP